MSRRRKRVVVVVAALVLLAGVGEVWQDSAAMRGRMAARFDVGRGRYRLLVYGLPPPGREEYARLLKERYGIEMRVVGFCTVSPALVEYCDSYDSASSRAAVQKFGRDIFRECFEATEKQQ